MIQKPSGSALFLLQERGFVNGRSFGLTLDGCTWHVLLWCWALDFVSECTYVGSDTCFRDAQKYPHIL